jgi:hypothetical protein
MRVTTWPHAHVRRQRASQECIADRPVE